MCTNYPSCSSFKLTHIHTTCYFKVTHIHHQHIHAQRTGCMRKHALFTAPSIAQDKVILTSAMAEVMLRKLHKERYIQYTWGADTYLTAEDLEEFGGGGGGGEGDGNEPESDNNGDSGVSSTLVEGG